MGASPGNVVVRVHCDKTSSTNNDKISVFHGKLVCVIVDSSLNL